MGLSSLSLISLYAYPFILAFRLSNKHLAFFLSLTLSLATFLNLLVFIFSLFITIRSFICFPSFQSLASLTFQYSITYRGGKKEQLKIVILSICLCYDFYFRLFRLFGKLKKKCLKNSRKKIEVTLTAFEVSLL